MIAAALAALALATASPSGLVYGSTSGFSDAFGDALKDGKVVELHVSGTDRDGYYGPDGSHTSFDSETYELTFPTKAVKALPTHFQVDGRFVAHPAGLNRGQKLWWFSRAR